jgi:hypothetical protein
VYPKRARMLAASRPAASSHKEPFGNPSRNTFLNDLGDRMPTDTGATGNDLDFFPEAGFQGSPLIGCLRYIQRLRCQVGCHAGISDGSPERWLSGAAAMPVSQPYRVFKQTQASSCPSSGRGALTIRPADSMPARRSATWMSGLTFRHLAGGVQIGVQGISGARHYSTRTGNMRCLR